MLKAKLVKLVLWYDLPDVVVSRADEYGNKFYKKYAYHLANKL